MKEAFFIVGDVEGYDKKFFLLQKIIEEICESIALTIFTGDIVGKGPGNIELLRWCFENQERIKLILGNKDANLQETVRGKTSNVQWINVLASELDKKENHPLRDFFMGAFTRYFVAQRFIVSHARLIDGKEVYEHTSKQLNGLNQSSRGKRYYQDSRGRVLLHGHHSREGQVIQRDLDDTGIVRIGLDSAAGKGKKTPLSGALIGRKQKIIRVIDTHGSRQKVRI